MLMCNTTTCSCATRQDANVQHNDMLICNTTRCLCAAQQDAYLLYVQHNKTLVCNTTRCLRVPQTICYVQHPPSALRQHQKNKCALCHTKCVYGREPKRPPKCSSRPQRDTRARVIFGTTAGALSHFFRRVRAKQGAQKLDSTALSFPHSFLPSYIRTGKARPRGIIHRNSTTSHYTSARAAIRKTPLSYTVPPRLTPFSAHHLATSTPLASLGAEKTPQKDPSPRDFQETPKKLPRNFQETSKKRLLSFVFRSCAC